MLTDAFVIVSVCVCVVGIAWRKEARCHIKLLECASYKNISYISSQRGICCTVGCWLHALSRDSINVYRAATSCSIQVVSRPYTFWSPCLSCLMGILQNNDTKVTKSKLHVSSTLSSTLLSFLFSFVYMTDACCNNEDGPPAFPSSLPQWLWLHHPALVPTESFVKKKHCPHCPCTPSDILL